MSHSLFNENLKGPRFLRALFSEVNRMARCLNHLFGAGVVPNEFGGFDISTKSSLNLSKFAFGWVRTEGRTVTIAAGYIKLRGAYYKVPETVVNVGGNISAKHLIIASGNDHGGQVQPNSVLESVYNGDASDEWRCILYRVYLSNGSPVMDMVGEGVGGIVP